MDLGVGLLWWALLAAPDAHEIDAALERVLRSDEYQTELPPARRELPAIERERPRPRRTERRPVEGTSRPRRARDPGPPRPAGDMRPVGSVLLWILASVFAVAAASWVVRQIQARRLARAALGDPERAAKGPAAPAPAPIPDWERLALAGRHADAIHAILLAVLARIGSARAGLKPAWTSREILRLVKLEDAPQRALASLVGLVEVTRFGGAHAREEEYRAALGCLGAIGDGARP